MSGGNGAAGTIQSVELLHGPWCSFPDLPGARLGHTQTGLVACGGGDPGSSGTETTCVKLRIDIFIGKLSWIQINKLKKERYYHTSWESPEGTVLMGGSVSGDTTELLDDNGGSSMHFPLKYWTE